MTKRLTGKRILITRPSQQAEVFADMIEQEGGEAIVLPLIDTVACSDNRAKYVRIVRDNELEWIVFTSANAVHFFEQALEAENVSFDKSSVRIAVIGPKTEQALAERGWEADLIPISFVAESLAEKLQEHVKKGERVLFPKSALARDVIPDRLAETGVQCMEWPLYQSTPVEASRQKLEKVMVEEKPDIITFMSPSAVNAFVFLMGEEKKQEWVTFPVVSIGPVTSEEAKINHFETIYSATPHSLEGMLLKLCDIVKGGNIT